MRKLQNLVAATLGIVVGAEVETECSPAWLWRPGRVECGGAWETVSLIYSALTGLVLPDRAPPREWRKLDIVLTYPDKSRQIVEVDEKQHFTAARATALEHYPSETQLGFDATVWLARSRESAGREPGGRFATARPPLFPGPGGRHRQRAFRDALTDLLAPEHDWLATVRISDQEITGAMAAPNPADGLTALLAARMPPHWVINRPPVTD